MLYKLRQYVTQWMYEEGNFEPYEPPVRMMDAFYPVDTARIWGIDISHWDGNVNLQVTKSLGASFVFIKGLDGTLSAKYFAENRWRAVDVGLHHAPYQWLYKNANVSCVKQAQAMATLLSKYPSVLPPVIDFEWTKYGGVSADPTYTDLRLYVTELLRLGVRKPLLYTAKGFTDKYYQIPADLQAMFEGLWVANYGAVTPAMPKGWAGWDFWQFSSSGDAKTYAPNDNGKLEVDLNYCVSKERLNQLAGIEEEDMTQDLTELIAVLNEIKDFIHDIAYNMTHVPDDEAPTKPPVVVSDGYTGPILGTYKVKGNPGDAITTILDSDGAGSTIIQASMANWLIANVPGWDDFVANEVFVRKDGYWYLNKMKLIPGQLVRIALVGGKTKEHPEGNGQIIGMNNSGIADRCVTILDNVTPANRPDLFHKIPNVPRYYPIVQPHQKPDHVLNAWWVPMELLEKVA